MSDLAIGITGSVLFLLVALIAFAIKLRQASGVVDELTPPGTLDLADLHPAPARPDPTATPWRGEPGPAGDWVPVWVCAERQRVLGHEPRNPAFTRCGEAMVDRRGYQLGALMMAGVAYERLQVSWCPGCYPPVPAPTGRRR